MENNNTQNNTNQEGFMDKVKKALGKTFKGIKNFFVKTGRTNSANCYGVIENIGDFLVYDDHALISALGMDDVVFTAKNVVSYTFVGLGRIRRNKATVSYKIVLDDEVVFPEAVRQKNDVKNLTATIKVEKDRSHFLGKGDVEYGKGDRVAPVEACDVYGYDDCFVIVVKLERRNGDKIEKYEESLLYPFGHISSIAEQRDKSFAVKFNDGKSLRFTTAGEKAYDIVRGLKAAE